jgi:Fe2+ transport system protein FeoA
LSLKTIFKYGTGVEMPTSLAEIPLGTSVTITSVDGPRAFRRRLLEMGLVPGVEVRVVTVAPLGDPLRIEVRGGQWSIRRAEAAQIKVDVEALAQAATRALLVAATL